MQAFHGWKAGRVQNVALARAPRTFVLTFARASRIDGVSFSLRTFVKTYKRFTDPHAQRTRNGVME
eukprot:215532-Pyramimonas_sp.AAC.1